MEFARGDGINGCPSSFEVSSLMAEAVIAVAQSKRATRNLDSPSRVPSWMYWILDKISLQLHILAFEVFFLLARLVGLIIGGIVAAVLLYAFIYGMFML